MTVPSTSQRFQLLLAPAGQLSGDGQLRELMLERRSRAGHPAHGARADATSSIWFLPPVLLQELKLNNGGSAQGIQEGLITEDPAVHVWLQLRFGGRSASTAELAQLAAKLERSWLEQQASGLPPAAPQPPVALAGALA